MRARHLAGALALAAAIGTTLLYLYRDLLPEFEHDVIITERQWRSAVAGAGFALPGTPDLARLDERLAAKGLKPGAPIFMRIFKREFELELWMQRQGRFELFATYPICRWSGQLGPKLKQGDGQAPEGFYTVDASALNPNSTYHRSFNLGYPNAFDRAHGRTGSLLMVHGACVSIGCYAMTDAVISEIWRLVTAALEGGQSRFQVQVMPFRMSDAALARRSGQANEPFWRSLKSGFDLFESTGVPPKISVCEGRYAFEPGTDAPDGSAPIEARCPAARASPG